MLLMLYLVRYNTSGCTLVRAEKTARIKQARDEAHAEVKQYLAQQEAILAQKKSEGMTDSSKSSKVLGLLLRLRLLLILLTLLAKKYKY
jgi:hypothetical protein